jgi:glycosyltransferase involved in cell wall biosynthesis
LQRISACFGSRPEHRMSTARVLAIANDSHVHGARVRQLLPHLPFRAEYLERDRTVSRFQSARAIWNAVRNGRWDLVYLEGTGLPLGLPAISAPRAGGLRYIVSSGDPVGGFFRTTRGPASGWIMEQYERQLYRYSAGFVGWTPYLSDRALKMGAPRAATVEGGVDLSRFRPLPAGARRDARETLGLGQAGLVSGVVGSLVWTPRQRYCYGLELVEMLRYLQRSDVSILIVGDGDARPILEQRIPAAMRHRVRFTGRLEGDALIRAINAMDIGFLTQTLDGLGKFRLTTKLPEYLACGVPVAMSPIPGFYDYAVDAGWPLPSRHPASEEFHRECARWIDTLEPAAIAAKAARARAVAEQRFDYSMLGRRFAEFVTSILDGRPITPPMPPSAAGRG